MSRGGAIRSIAMVLVLMSTTSVQAAVESTNMPTLASLYPAPPRYRFGVDNLDDTLGWGSLDVDDTTAKLFTQTSGAPAPAAAPEPDSQSSPTP